MPMCDYCGGEYKRDDMYYDDVCIECAGVWSAVRAQKVEMYVVKALSFNCKFCGNANTNEFHKGDTVTRCSNCGERHTIEVDYDFSEEVR